jgi:hypothetical protein
VITISSKSLPAKLGRLPTLVSTQFVRGMPKEGESKLHAYGATASNLLSTFEMSCGRDHPNTLATSEATSKKKEVGPAIALSIGIRPNTEETLDAVFKPEVIGPSPFLSLRSISPWGIVGV